VIVQEFLDLSGGIPGIIQGPHDFRLIMVNGEVALCYVRTPPAGKLIANVAQGGIFKIIDPPFIPKEALEIALQLDRTLHEYEYRLYSIDMGRLRDGTWKIIELNTPPGLFATQGDPRIRRYQELTADLLISAAKGMNYRAAS
jgi:glutathione synthase/RimK-type ligase-like ATP-grasp enzyme